jgi:Arc/MetJ family transcription regulator
MRTNIEIDDELMRQAMAATGSPTKKAAVEEALRLLVTLKNQKQAVDELWGKVVWRGHDDDWFASDEEILEKRRQEDRKAAHQQSGEEVREPEPVGATVPI